VRRHYLSSDEDSARWNDFRFRAGDIVISTRTKHGTTWMQMICALLVFGTPELPGTLAELSPWLDWLVMPADEVRARLDAQTHRRFIKTHTPLDGLPLDRRATYVVVARNPLDARRSHLHHRRNLDRELMSRLSGQPQVHAPGDVTEHEWLVEWIDRSCDWRVDLDSLDGVVHHVADAWSRRDEPNIVLVHYDDLSRDLDGEMRRLASRFDIEVDEATWPALVDAATLDHMRSRADAVAPGPPGLIKEPTKFFRAGEVGTARALLTESEVGRYERRLDALASRDLLAWLDRSVRENPEVPRQPKS
jgi:hypothetical protein